jgi:hypothetical protein
VAWLTAGAGVGFVLLAMTVYSVGLLVDRPYDHFVWQAAAFLEGHVAIRYPTAENSYFQDVLPTIGSDGVPRGFIPFPPLPAVILLPFVVLGGLTTPDRIVFIALAAIDVGICWWLVGRLPVRLAVRVAVTVFFAFGTVFWYTAHVSTTWYQAHIAAVGLAMLAVGLALGGDRTAFLPAGHDPAADGSLGAVMRNGLRIDRRQFAAGFLFGLACTARLTVVFAAPFFLLVGGGSSWWRRGWSAGLGALIPVAALFAFNLVSTGQLFHPAYQFLYELEARYYPSLGYNADWAIEDPRYLAQNLGIMLLGTPLLLPDAWPNSLAAVPQPFCVDPGAVRGLFDLSCPLAVPRDVGMSVLLTSPALLLVAPAVWAHGRSRLVAGSVLAIVLVAFVNLMHFSQGWVQFGYRFSNDFVPWAVVLVALGADRIAGRTVGVAVIAALVVGSVLVNAWGVAWGGLLGW